MVVLSNAGDHVPVIPLVEVVGKGDNASPIQIGATTANVGVAGVEFTIISSVVVVAHCPASGVNV